MTEASSAVETAADQLGATASISNPPAADPSAKHTIYSLTVLDVKYWGLKRTGDGLAFTILRRCEDDLINATKLLRGFDLGGINRHRLIHSGPYSPINERRDTDVRGTWVSLDRARELVKRFKLEAQVGGILLDREILQVKAVPAEVIEKKRRADVVGSASRAAPYHVRTERAPSPTTAAGPSIQPQARQSSSDMSGISTFPVPGPSAEPQTSGSLPVVFRAPKTSAVPAPVPSLGAQAELSKSAASTDTNSLAAGDELPSSLKAIFHSHIVISMTYSGSGDKNPGLPTSVQTKALVGAAQMIYESFESSETGFSAEEEAGESKPAASKDCPDTYILAAMRAHALISAAYPAPPTATSAGHSAPPRSVHPTPAQLAALTEVFQTIVRSARRVKTDPPAGTQPKPAPSQSSSSSSSSPPPSSVPSALPAIDPTSWSVEQVVSFGRSKGWSEDGVLCHLRQNKLSGSSMMSLCRDSFSLEVLSQIGIVAINDKLMVLAAVEALRNQP
ncbi:hypothetical protein CF326_g1170 [Tilletia indica]|nr:hypothetical protein CF326_g1170 [Tilletia indica]